jgi:hypothetical protein
LRIATLLAVAIVVIPLEALLLPEVLDTRPACVRAEEWVRAHAGDLPTLYDQLVSYPMAHRRAIFGNLAPEARAGLWDQQLSRFRAERKLTTEQQEFVEWCQRDIVTAENYRGGGPEKDVLGTAHDKIEALFPDYEDRRVFVQLGPIEPRLASFEGARLSLAERLRTTFSRGSSPVPEVREVNGPQRPTFLSPDVHAQTTYGTCTCSVEGGGYYWWECGQTGTYACRQPGCASWTACGLFGLAPCDGCCCWFSHPEFCNC